MAVDKVNYIAPRERAQATGKAAIGAEHSKYTRDLMNRITTNPRLPGSTLEGASRVFTGFLGGYHGGQMKQQELSQREALIAALDGKELSPMTTQLIAQGDPSAINSVVQQEVADRNRGLRRSDEREQEARANAEYRDRLKFQQPFNIEARKAEHAAAVARAVAVQNAKNAATGERETHKLEAKAAHRVKMDDKNLKGLQKDYGAGMEGTDVLARWDDAYAQPSDYPVGNNLVNWINSVNPLATDAQIKSQSFWRDYNKQGVLVERHGLFGAALTATEKEEWDKSDINPSMSPKAAREAIISRRDFMARKMHKAVKVLASKYDNQQLRDFFKLPQDADLSDPATYAERVKNGIDIASGIPKDVPAEAAEKPAMMDPSASPKEEAAPTAPPKAGGLSQDGAYRFKGGNPNDAKNWEEVAK